MINPNFENYSLILIKKDKVIFKSKKTGLKPLIECIDKFKNKIEGYTLYDKVVGLAAAKLIIYSEFISNVITPICSKQAFDLLNERNIKIKSNKIVENILNKSKEGICPMEIKAAEAGDNEDFLILIKRCSKRKI